VALNQISIDIGVYNERLSIILGFITLAFLLANLFSCRSFLSFLDRAGVKNPSGNPVYSSFFKYHSLYWWGLMFSLVIHFLVGVMHLSYTDPADPDNYLHIYVFLAGGAAFVVTLGVYASCRSFASLLKLITGKNPLSGNLFNSLYRFHGYYWITLVAIVIVHFIFAYLHTGIWAN
jgi:hypothetical protein